MRYWDAVVVGHAISGAKWLYRLRIAQVLVTILLAVIFFAHSDTPAKFIFVAFVAPFSLFSLVPVWDRFKPSVILVCCLIYLISMDVASFLDVGSFTHDVWTQSYQSIFVLLFVLIVGGLVVAYDDFSKSFFLFVSPIVAASAAVNVFFFMRDMVPPDSAFYYMRLNTSVGMPAYANSTNISPTYAIFFVATVSLLLRENVLRVSRVILGLSAIVLLGGVLLTQARGGALAVVAGMLTMAFTAQRSSVRWLVLGAVSAIVVVGFALEPVRGQILSRGFSARPEVWRGFLTLIWERPLAGYGSFNTAGVWVEDRVFLDQAHNLVLSGWFRGGLFSALAMAVILVGGLYWSWRFWLRTRQATPLLMMATIFTAGMFDYQLMITNPTWPWVTFWLPFGLCVGAEMNVRRTRPQGMPSLQREAGYLG